MRLFVAITLLTLSATSVAGEKVNKSLDVEADGRVDVSNIRGDIKISGWDKASVKVEGELDDLAEKFIFETSGGVTTIEVKLPKENHRRGDGSKLKIYIPTDSSLNFKGVATDVDVDNVKGGTDITSVSGDVKINELENRLFVNAVSGDIKVRNFVGKTELKSVSGDVDATMDAEFLRVSSVSGDAYVKVNSFRDAEVSSVSGDVKLYGEMQSGGDLHMSTVSGNAYFYTSESLSANISLETGPGGDIVNDISDEEPSSSFIQTKRLRITLGGGSGSIRMSTVSGTIGLKK